jgi:GIY-YIG catalytic domain
MHPLFADLTSSLEPAFERLIAMPAHNPLALPRQMPSAGVYVFSEASTHLYVGRSNRLKRRLSNHCRQSATDKMAAFAFKLAREATDNLRATYKTKGSRADLMKDPVFLQAFDNAKERIRAMEVRFVEETHPVRQCLLEIYVAVALATPYNDFDTH